MTNIQCVRFIGNKVVCGGVGGGGGGGGGGGAGAGTLNDLWAFDPVSSGWSELSGGQAGPARYFHGMGAAGGRLLVFGGRTATAFLAGLQAWDPVRGAWEDLSGPAAGSAPSARAYPGVAGQEGALYVFGGWGAGGACVRVQEWGKRGEVDYGKYKR